MSGDDAFGRVWQERRMARRVAEHAEIVSIVSDALSEIYQYDVAGTDEASALIQMLSDRGVVLAKGADQ